jgi:hypothetical protein
MTVRDLRFAMANGTEKVKILKRMRKLLGVQTAPKVIWILWAYGLRRDPQLQKLREASIWMPLLIRQNRAMSFSVWC